MWGGVFIIYLKIEQAHSSFYKGDQSNGFCQRPSFQVVLKPVNKLNTQKQSHAQVINKAHCSSAHKTQTQFICPCCVPCLGCCVHIYSLLSPKYLSRLGTQSTFGAIVWGVISCHVCNKLFMIHDQFSIHMEEKTKTDNCMLIFQI